MTILALVYQKIESEDKVWHFSFKTEAEIIINENNIYDAFHQSMLKLYQAYKNF